MSIWTENQTLKFIQMYRDRPSLWNPSAVGYRDKQIRDEMFMELSNEFCLEKVEIEKKLKGLQTQFARERRKEEHRRKGSEMYKSKWFAYNSMLFLVHKKKPKKGKCKGKSILSLPEISVKTEIDEDSSNKDDCSEFSFEDKIQIDDQQSSATEQLVKTAQTDTLPLKTRPIFKRVKQNSHLKGTANRNNNKAFNLITTLIEKQKTAKDEYTFFGEQVAFRLRKIASPGARFVVQNLINKALFEGEIGMHNGPSDLNTQKSVLGKCSPEVSFSEMQVKSETIDEI